MSDESGKSYVIYKHKCQFCGLDFYSRNTGDKWCSDDCKKAFKKSQTDEYAKRKWKAEVEETHKSLKDLANAATKAGMSYGEYIAKFGN